MMDWLGISEAILVSHSRYYVKENPPTLMEVFGNPFEGECCQQKVHKHRFIHLNMSISSSSEDERGNTNGNRFLQRCFGVDRWCTIYEEDEGFKLLADLSLCTYFGCGTPKHTHVPKIVSVANSEDFDGTDSLSDMCDDNLMKEQQPDSENAEEVLPTAPKPDPPQCSQDLHVVHLIHPLPTMPPSNPTPSLIDSTSTAPHYNNDECSRITAHYESREALEDSDEENLPPLSTIVICPRRKVRQRSPDHLDDFPPYVLGKKKSAVKEAEPEDDYSVEEFPADEDPSTVHPHDTSSKHLRRAYV